MTRVMWNELIWACVLHVWSISDDWDDDQCPAAEKQGEFKDVQETDELWSSPIVWTVLCGISCWPRRPCRKVDADEYGL
jgi:hypothetical protein